MRRPGLCVAALLVVFVATSVAEAQSTRGPPSAATVLANVQRYYANAKQLTALFRQTVTIATFRTSKISNGELWVVTPSDFRFDYMAARNGNVVVTKSFVWNGTTLWAIDHDNKQIVEGQLQASALPAAISFLTGSNALSSQFTVALNTSRKFGGNVDLVLELTPSQASSQYKQVFLVVDPADWRVKASIVIDSNGNKNQFNFFMPNLTATTKASWFQVNPASLPTYKLVQRNPSPGTGSGAAAVPSPTP